MRNIQYIGLLLSTLIAIATGTASVGMTQDTVYLTVFVQHGVQFLGSLSNYYDVVRSIPYEPTPFVPRQLPRRCQA